MSVARYAVLGALACCAAHGCAPADGDTFFVQRAGATMPVHVHGPLRSGVFVVVLHGGPGDSALFYRQSPAFRALEERWAVVFWDQRGAGNSYGSSTGAAIDLEQHVEDTAAVLTALQARHRVSAVVLLGHSWGGRLGAEYLRSPRFDPIVRGFIDVDGLDGYASTYERSRAWVLREGPVRKQFGHAAAPIDEAIAWHRERETLDDSSFDAAFTDFATHARLLRAMNGYDYDPAQVGEVAGVDAELAFGSSLDLLALAAHQQNALFNWDHSDEEVRRLLDDPDLSAVTVPWRFVWGLHDGAIPLEVAERKRERLPCGAGEWACAITVLERSGHSPMFEEPEAFFDEVAAFVWQVR